MLNIHLIYKPPGSLRILFWYLGRPRHLIQLNIFRSLLIPGGGFCKGIIIHGILTPTGFLPNGQSKLRIKGDVKVVSAHAGRYINSLYGYMVRWSIYENI